MKPTTREKLRAAARRLETSQTALKSVVEILDGIKGGDDSARVFFEIGRAQMTAQLAILPEDRRAEN